MSTYVDGFALPIKKSGIAAYKKLASKAGKIWMEHGALQYVEAVMEDATEYPFCSSFAKMVKPKADETIVVAFITYKSRKHRDAVNKKVHSDPRMTCDESAPLPFDCKKMAFNGFETLVDL